MSVRDILLAAFTAVVWGLAFVATRYGVEGFTPLQLTAVRFLIASVPAVLLPRPSVPLHMIVAVGATLFAGQFLLLFLAFRVGMPPGLAAVTQQSHIFFTVLIAAAFLGERPNVRQWAGMSLAATGLGLIGTTVWADLPVAALMLALGAALSWAIGNVLLKGCPGVSMYRLVVWCSLVPPLPMLLLSALRGEPSLPRSMLAAPWPSLAGALYLGLAATSVYAIWGDLLARYPAARVGPFALLSPVAGVAGSAIMFGERFSTLCYLGMFMILAGVSFVVVGPRSLGSRSEWVAPAKTPLIR